MKRHYLLLIYLFTTNIALTQNQGLLPTQLPAHEIAKPQPQIKTYPPLTQYLYSDRWKGNVMWATSEAGHSSTIPDIVFTLFGEAIWQSPFQEIVPAQPGKFTVNGNDLSISFSYGPYKYSFKGVYNFNNGIISGTFTQTRMKYIPITRGYTPGIVSGTFTMTKK